MAQGVADGDSKAEPLPITLRIPMKSQSCFRLIAILSAFSIGFPVLAESGPARLDDVAKRGAQAMPFDLEKTRHIFTKTDAGGIQQVIARQASDQAQIDLIRQHLKEIAGQFRLGDFSGPASIHGDRMPGLARLRQAKPGEWNVEYRDLENGAEIRYSSAMPEIVQAVHQWFDAQLSDHGRHAMPGHPHAMHHGQ